MANTTKRTTQNRELILEMLRGGTTRKAAYSAVLMSHQTFAEWVKEDEGFALDVEKAQQEAITSNVELILRAAQPRTVKKTRTEFKKGKKVAQTVEEYEEEGDWRAAAWLNERADPENFGKRVDLTSKGEKLPATTVLLGLNEIDDAELERRIAAAQGGTAPPDLPEAS